MLPQQSGNAAILPLFLALLLGMLLTACGSVDQAQDSSALGTRWGEALESPVTTAAFRRYGNDPVAVEVMRYSAKAGVGQRIDQVRMADGMIGLRVLTEAGVPWPIYHVDGDQTLQGRIGERYVLEYRNRSTDQTYEIVTTVDGLDVLKGQPGSLKSRGYALRPGQVLRIEGFRKNASEIAAFRFSGSGDSYAAQRRGGSGDNVGVIGTAVFRLRDQGQAGRPVCGNGPCAFPASDDRQSEYAAPPPG